MKKAPLNKTQVLTKSMNMGIWVVVTSNQLFITGSFTETKFSKKVFIFHKICVKLKYCQVNCQSLKYRAILKVLSTVFDKNICSFCWL